MVERRREGEARRTRQKQPGRELIRKRKDSPFWCLNFTVEGRRFRDSLRTGDEALACELALHKHREAVEHIRLGRAPILHMTLNEAAVRWWQEVGQHQSSGRSRRYLMRNVLAVIGAGTRLADINDARILELMAHLRTERSTTDRLGRTKHWQPATNSTINRYLSLLRSLFGRARSLWKVSVAEVSWDELWQKEADYPELFLTYEQANALVDAAIPHAKRPILLALYTGLRKENVVKLCWEQVSLDMKRITLLQKGDRTMVVHLIAEAVDLLAELEPDPVKRRGYVFTYGHPVVACPCAACRAKAHQGKPLGRLTGAFYTARSAIGLPHVRFHDLRHTVASWLLAKGYTLAHVKQVLGHTNISTTMRYAHLEKSAVPAAMGDALSFGAAPRPAPKRKESA